MVSSLQEHLVATNLLPYKGKLFHGRYTARVFNLIVQEGFKAMSGATSSIRDIVKYVKSSQARKQRFEEMIEQVGISCEKRPPLDVSTRWNSTYLMLNSALQYRRAFEALAREDTQYIHLPSIEEWIMADKLCNMSKVFYNATLVVSGSKYPTASCYFHEIWEVKKMLERESLNPDIVIACMVDEMKRKFQKYWDLSFLKICVPVVLDPRFKLGFLEYRLSRGFGDSAYRYFSKVKKAIRKLFDEYSSQIGDSSIGNAQEDSNAETIIDKSNP